MKKPGRQDSKYSSAWLGKWISASHGRRHTGMHSPAVFFIHSWWVEAEKESDCEGVGSGESPACIQVSSINYNGQSRWFRGIIILTGINEGEFDWWKERHSCLLGWIHGQSALLRRKAEKYCFCLFVFLSSLLCFLCCHFVSRWTWFLSFSFVALVHIFF